MAEMCTCNFSLLATTQVRAGGVACSWCGRAWTRNGRQFVMDEPTAAKVRRFLERGGEIAFVGRLERVVFIDPDAVVPAPGKAVLERCPDCTDGVGYGGRACEFCGGVGRQVWKACPRCGDTAMWS